MHGDTSQAKYSARNQKLFLKNHLNNLEKIYKNKMKKNTKEYNE